LRGHFLDGCEIIPVSAVTGEGIEDLKKSLARLFGEVESKSSDGPFRLPVDRVFTMRGFGTVITGTSISGRLQVGDPVFIYPSELKSKVRGIQVHSLDVPEVLPGQRTAVNLQGMERALIQRGDVLASPGALAASHMIDIQLDLLKSAPRPLKHRAKIRFHTGTAEHLATIVLLDREELKPGESTFAQVRLDHPQRCSGAPVRDALLFPGPDVGWDHLHPLPRTQGMGKREAAKALETLYKAACPTSSCAPPRWGLAGLGEQELRIRTNVAQKFLEKTLQSSPA